jgi:hypothetical protein
MPRASLGCIATIKGEHGQEIKAQIHALEEELNQQLFDYFVSAGIGKPIGRRPVLRRFRRHHVKLMFSPNDQYTYCK